MPRYMVQGRYSPDGAKGLLASGGTARRDHLAQLAEGLGGKLEAFYWAFGETDVFAIVDLPDNATVTALSLTASASGAVAIRTSVLITPEELDQASQKSVPYRPPGA